MTGFESLEERARSLAAAHIVDATAKGRPLVPRLQESAKAIAAACVREHLNSGEAAVWLVENQMFVVGHIREVRRSLPKVYYGQLPRLGDGPLSGYPRVYAIAEEIITWADTISQEAVTAFAAAYQTATPLSMGELWALGAMLRLALIFKLGDVARQGLSDTDAVKKSVLGLRAVGLVSWKDLFEDVSIVDGILREDPADVYARMDFPSRDMYRHAIEGLARTSGREEGEVARRVVETAGVAPEGSLARHVGYHLIDNGASAFRRILGCRTSWRARIRQSILDHPEFYYLGGIELATFIVIALLLSQLSALEPQLIAFLLLFLPATGAAVSLINQKVTLLLPPRRPARLDFSSGIPADSATMIVVPTLMLSPAFVSKLLEDLEVRFLANRDYNFSFALLTDFPDASEPAPDDRDLVELCAEGIRRLNSRYSHYGRDFFYLFHREREWNPKQFSFMGWERKRGKLIHFNNLLCGESDDFQVKVGDLSVLPHIRYVLTLDTDTQLPMDSARKMVATIAHPLNRPVVDPVTRIVRRGYGILQPRVGISVHSAGRTRLARIYSGQTGIDLYTTAVSDVYQDLFGEGIYTGKGLYDVKVFQQVLSRRFPHDALLSHDLIEGAYARAGLVSDIEVIDDYPSHYGAYSKRKHRWVRGDWQVMLWMLPRVPHFDGGFVPNPLSLISRWKIFDNLRRSVLEITTFLLLVAGWFFLPGGPEYWTIAVLVLLLLPTWTEFVLTLPRFPERRFWRAHIRETFFHLFAGHLNATLMLTFLAHQSLLMLDAIVRTLVRTVTRRRLLEWESAAEAERSGRTNFRSLHSYLWIASILSAATGGLLALANPDALGPAVPVLATWVLAPAVAMWLNAAIPQEAGITAPDDREFLRQVGQRTWNYFADFSDDEENWLIPDNYQRDLATPAHRSSPTNLGLLLNANLAAVDLGFLSVGEFVERTNRTLESMSRLERYRGHFYNWYDNQTRAPLWPPFVSTVDSGNLAASLLTLKQGCLEIAAKCSVPEVREELKKLAAVAGRWFDGMDFSFLYDQKKKLLRIGYDPLLQQGDESYYDLLASEARTASLLAIAKGDVPQEHWFHLGRTLTLYAGNRVLLSWSGTMFEYLMPLLWTHRWPGTLLDRTARAAVDCQRAFAAEHSIPWGVSECAFLARDTNGNYRYHAFGLPAVSLRRDHPDDLVVAPYAAALALCVDPREAVRNMKGQAKRGWLSEYGFYDAVQFTNGKRSEEGRGEPVETFMAHHLGMTLLAIDNALNDSPMRRRFHADPLVQAVELLLQERVPAAAWVVKPTAPPPDLFIPDGQEESRKAAV